MEISAITDDLLVGATPDTEDIPQLAKMGVKLVISMRRREQPPHYDNTGIAYLNIPSFDFPFIDIGNERLKEGVKQALAAINQGGKVMVYCQFGAHRSVAMAAAILIGQGYGAEEAMALLDRQRDAADPYIWYIKRQILSFERYLAKSPI